MLVFFVFLVCLRTWCEAKHFYSHTELLIGLRCQVAVTSDFQWNHNIPLDIARPPESPWIVVGPSKRRRRRKERKQKRGCRAGLLAQLRKQPHKPPLTSIFLTNARSIVHKIDELELHLAANCFVRDCCVMIITETWLHQLIPDASALLAGPTIHRSDRNKDSGKSRGGGLCVYVHNDWCASSKSHSLLPGHGSNDSGLYLVCL